MLVFVRDLGGVPDDEVGGAWLQVVVVLSSYFGKFWRFETSMSLAKVKLFCVS